MLNFLKSKIILDWRVCTGVHSGALSCVLLTPVPSPSTHTLSWAPPGVTPEQKSQEQPLRTAESDPHPPLAPWKFVLIRFFLLFSSSIFCHWFSWQNETEVMNCIFYQLFFFSHYMYHVYLANFNELSCTLLFLDFHIINILFHKDINDVNISIFVKLSFINNEEL